MAIAVEAGIKALRAHFVRETIEGIIQADPAFLQYSDTIQQIIENPNANVYEQMGAGSFDLTGFLVGPEDHTMEVVYELQNWLTTGNDAAADGLIRAADGAFLNTHGYLSRQELLSGGVLASGRRIYTVGKGGRVGSVNISGDPGTGEPVVIKLGYVFEKLRSYVCDQPAATGVVTIVSDNAADTTQSVTIENETAGVTETIALNGTTPVPGATSFTDIDAFELDAETEGDITLTHTAVVVATILGKVSNGGFEGDLGVPLLGSGSFEAALGTAYELIVGSTMQRGGGDFEANATISAFEVNVENNMEISPRVDSRRRRIVEGGRKITVKASIFSSIGSHTAFVEHLTVVQSDIVWTLNGGTLTMSNSALTGLGGRKYVAGDAVMRRDNTFTARGLVIA